MRPRGNSGRPQEWTCYDSSRFHLLWGRRQRSTISDSKGGFRSGVNTPWVAQEDWKAFIAYENDINREFAAEPFVAVCACVLHRTLQHLVDQVMARHHLGVIKRCGEWSLLPRPG